jgi:hypothetical protein
MICPEIKNFKVSHAVKYWLFPACKGVREKSKSLNGGSGLETWEHTSHSELREKEGG